MHQQIPQPSYLQAHHRIYTQIQLLRPDGMRRPQARLLFLRPPRDGGASLASRTELTGGTESGHDAVQIIHIKGLRELLFDNVQLHSQRHRRALVAALIGAIVLPLLFRQPVLPRTTRLADELEHLQANPEPAI